MIGGRFRHRAVDDLRTPCRLFKIDSFRKLTGAHTGKDRRQDQKDQKPRNDVAEEQAKQRIRLIERMRIHDQLPRASSIAPSYEKSVCVSTSADNTTNHYLI